MEFNEMRKIWDTQNNEPLYGINEAALHRHILSKQRQGYHISNINELLSIIVYSLTGCFVLFMGSGHTPSNIFIYLQAAWMLGSALYVLVSRIRRISSGHQYDRSLLGDLRHAIALAGYQVGLSRLLRWNMLPVALLIVLGLYNGGKSLWVLLGIAVFFVFTWYASGWEHRIYKNRKRRLEALQDKLKNEMPSDVSSLPFIQ
jgi:hypothetical protein